MNASKFSFKAPKRWLVPTILIAVAVAAGLFIFRDKIFTKKQQINFPDSSSNITLEGMGIESIIESDPAMIAVHYPVTAFQNINRTIEGWIKQELADFRAGQTNHPADAAEAEFYITFEAYKYKGLLSFKFSEYSSSNRQAHGAEKIQTMVFDTSNEQPLTLQDLLLQPDFLKTVSEKSYDYFKDQPEFSGNLEQLQEGTAPVVGNFQHFILTENELEITFDPYQIAARSAGAPVYKMPLSEVESVRQKPFEDQDEAARRREEESQREKDNLAQVPDQVAVSPEDLDALKDKKLLALTFDDGTHPTNTVELLDFLKSENTRATFFVLGSRAAAYPNILRRMVAEGHQVGSHTYNHKQLTALGAADLTYEIDAANEAIKSAIGSYPAALRPPYGAYNDAVRARANMPIILWSIDPQDWKYRNAETVYSNVVPHAKDGDIILLHDIHPTSVQAAKQIIPKLKSDGFTFVTVDTLIRVRRDAPQNGAVYSSVR